MVDITMPNKLEIFISSKVSCFGSIFFLFEKRQISSSLTNTVFSQSKEVIILFIGLKQLFISSNHQSPLTVFFSSSDELAESSRFRNVITLRCTASCEAGLSLTAKWSMSSLLPPERVFKDLVPARKKSLAAGPKSRKTTHRSRPAKTKLKSVRHRSAPGCLSLNYAHQGITIKILCVKQLVSNAVICGLTCKDLQNHLTSGRLAY